jgi:hypothetical protein
MTRGLLALTLCGIFFSGCDTDKIARLERENKELHELVEKQQATADLDLQAKCARDSKNWFNENWQRDKTTTLLDYTNHYNKSRSKCFILVEYHYSLEAGNWVNDLSLWDVYENSKHAQFTEQHVFSPVISGVKPYDKVLSCAGPDKECKTQDEFNGLISSYLNN